jgi:hypothetical protein
MKRPRFRRWPAAIRLLAAGAVLGAFAAGCSSQRAAPRGSVASCTAFGVAAVRHHVTVTSLPPACQDLTGSQFSLAVSSAVRTAAAGADGKVAQREQLAAASRYLRYLIARVPAPPARRQPPAPASPRIGKTVLGLAALCAWLATIGLGLKMLARWLRRGRVLSVRRWRAAARNLAHLALAVVGLLIWVAYLGTGAAGLAWAACALLAAVTGLGMTLVFLPPPASAAGAGAPAAAPGTPGPPRRRYPVVFTVGAHIVLATVTLLLAVLAAIGIS